MNSSFDSTNIKTNFMMRDLIENDTNTVNSTFFFPSKLALKNNLLEQKNKGSFLISNTDLLKDTSSLGLFPLRKEEKSKFRNKILNLNMDKYKDSWIDIASQDISKIVLIKVIDQCYYEGHLHLKNKLDSEYILVKFINEKNQYTITPSFFYIKPRSEILINIKRFDKLAPDEPSSSVKDCILMITAKTKNEIEDLNDLKVYLRKEDIFSPDYQLFSYSLILDNGHNPLYYDKLVEERKKMIELFYEKTNINGIKDTNVLKEHIENMKMSIKQYKQKIRQKERELETILEKQKDLISRENTKVDNNKKVIFDEEVFYEVKDGKRKIKSKNSESSNSNNFYSKIFDMTHDEEGITIPMLLFGLSISLFIGKFIKSALFS
jgi:hypothetical protein